MRTYTKLVAVTLAVTCLYSGVTDADTATDILEAAGVKGGLIVHLGSGDGELTAALHANESYIVCGLDSDPKNVEKARKHIQSLGIYGKVSVSDFNGQHLPYAENLVNLVVVSGGPSQVSGKEIERILVPNGIAVIEKKANDQLLSTINHQLSAIGGGFVMFTKPRPAEIDDWTHYRHDAGNNPVANDTVSGPPRRMQWVAKPLWLRSHEVPSGINALVTSGGRIFYTFDEGPIGISDSRLPAKWSLIARDAFNGVLLWKVPIPKWGWQTWLSNLKGADWKFTGGLRSTVPKEVKDLLVADEERVYFTLGQGAPVSVIDASSGKILHVCKGTEGASALRLSDGILLVASKSLVAIKVDSGRQLWEKDGVRGGDTVAIHNKRVFCVSKNSLICLELESGKKVWSSIPEIKNADKVTAHDGTVVLSSRTEMQAFSAGKGRSLWKKQDKKGSKRRDIFIVNGLVWRDYAGTGYDLRTGEVKKKISTETLRSPQHHHRCYGNKATTRYIISAMEGLEYMDFVDDQHSRNNWLRGVCTYGIMPANGMVYVPPDQCFCQPGVKLLGFAALGPAGKTTDSGHKFETRLEKGPAYQEIQNRKSGASRAQADDWPMYRHDIQRHGTSKTHVGPGVKELWQIEIGGRLSQPVVANNKLLVASIDTHTVHALNATNGKRLWSFTAGGRVDSPPTIYSGLVIFGAADGKVYCLRESDGELAWRFNAAPYKRLISAFNQVESAWPVNGSLLLKDGVVYCNAGRSTFLDSGIHLYGLDPVSGKVLYQAREEGPYADHTKGFGHAYWQEGSRNDVLVSDGADIYIMQLKFNCKLERQILPTITLLGDRKFGSHVFSTAGFLDDEWYNRTFWMNTDRWPGYYLANQAPKSGQLLVVDEELTYGVKVFWTRNRHSPMFFPATKGYILVADDNDNEPGLISGKENWKPVEWLPDYHMARNKSNRKHDAPTEDRITGAPHLDTLDAITKNKDKGVGFLRVKPAKWMTWLPVRIRAMVKANKTLFVAGPKDVLDDEDPLASFDGSKGAVLWSVSARDGKKLAELELDSAPVFDGLIAAEKRLFASITDGTVRCFGKK